MAHPLLKKAACGSLYLQNAPILSSVMLDFQHGVWLEQWFEFPRAKWCFKITRLEMMKPGPTLMPSDQLMNTEQKHVLIQEHKHVNYYVLKWGSQYSYTMSYIKNKINLYRIWPKEYIILGFFIQIPRSWIKHVWSHKANKKGKVIPAFNYVTMPHRQRGQ